MGSNNQTIYVFVKLSHYCNSVIKLKNTLSFGKLNPKMVLSTRVGLHLVHQLFFKTVNGSYVKHISPDLLYYLDPIAIAYWAMDDGTWEQYGFSLATQGFTFDDVYRLAGILHYLYGIHCSVQNRSGKPGLYIKAKSMNVFCSIVKPHFHPSKTTKRIPFPLIPIHSIPNWPS